VIILKSHSQQILQNDSRFVFTFMMPQERLT